MQKEPTIVVVETQKEPTQVAAIVFHKNEKPRVKLQVEGSLAEDFLKAWKSVLAQGGLPLDTGRATPSGAIEHGTQLVNPDDPSYAYAVGPALQKHSYSAKVGKAYRGLAFSQSDSKLKNKLPFAHLRIYDAKAVTLIGLEAHSEWARLAAAAKKIFGEAASEGKLFRGNYYLRFTPTAFVDGDDLVTRIGESFKKQGIRGTPADVYQ